MLRWITAGESHGPALVAVLEGMVAGNREGDSYGAHYIVRADAQGRTREVRVRYAGSHSLHVTADGEGNWHDEQRGRAIHRLRGCIDVDIGATAATNTLPIRRLGLAIGDACAISAAWSGVGSVTAVSVITRLYIFASYFAAGLFEWRSEAGGHRRGRRGLGPA